MELPDTWKFEMIRAETLAEIDSLKKEVGCSAILALVNEYREMKNLDKYSDNTTEALLCVGFWTGLRAAVQFCDMKP